MTTPTDRSREQRLRRAAERQGFGLHKSRTRDPLAINFNTWTIESVLSAASPVQVQSLDEVEEHLSRPQSGSSGIGISGLGDMLVELLHENADEVQTAARRTFERHPGTTPERVAKIAQIDVIDPVIDELCELIEQTFEGWANS
jgi:hypothetical protein